MLAASPLNDNSEASGFHTDIDKDMEDSTDSSGHEKDSAEKTKKRKSLEINGILIDNFLFSDNLNECVDFLLRKDKSDLKKNVTKVIRHNASGKIKEKKKRQRKNMDQHYLLLEQFEKDPNWDKKTIQSLSDKLGLKESQIYKWNWDQRKKQNMEV
jgi:hypothetical protein